MILSIFFFISTNGAGDVRNWHFQIWFEGRKMSQIPRSLDPLGLSDVSLVRHECLSLALQVALL